MLSEGPKIWGVGKHKKVEGLLNGKVLLLVLIKYGVKGWGPALGPKGAPALF